jgi:hypothetical protein
MLRCRPAGLILVAAAMLGLVVIGPGLAEASQYLGKVVWTWHKTMDELGPTDKTETVAVSLFGLGNSCYEMVGSSVDNDIGGTQFAGGSAMLVGSSLVMTISSSKVRADGRQETGIFQGEVDKTTFNGTGWVIKKRFDPANHLFTDKYASGTLTVVGNPPPLAATATAPTSLLLLDK